MSTSRLRYEITFSGSWPIYARPVQFGCKLAWFSAESQLIIKRASVHVICTNIMIVTISNLRFCLIVIIVIISYSG